MNHQDHVALLRDGVAEGNSVWADLGAGSGAFTLALADCLGGRATIHAVDKQARPLAELQRQMRRRFPGVALVAHVADYKQLLSLPPLDGLLMANSLHFQQEKEGLVRSLSRYLRPGGRFILVEYNTDRGNRWVPYPLSYPAWESLADANGLADTRLLATVPSSFLGQFYAALSFRPPMVSG